MLEQIKMENLPVKAPKYQVVNCLKFFPAFPSETLKEALNYKPEDDDLFVVTYMKSGTTWTQQICTLIFSDGEVTQELKDKGLFHLSPFLELFGDAVKEMPTRKIIKTHLPFNVQPYNPKARYIYVARNPKDVLVSSCIHVNLLRDYAFDGTAHDLLPYFINGDLDVGGWADHISSWWEHRNDPNVLFILYEDMKADIRGSIRKIAAFMGDEYIKKMDENPEMLEKIVKHSDIPFMKETTNKDINRLLDGTDLVHKDREYHLVRKGVVGDWKNELSAEDNEVFEKWFEETFKNSGIYNLWDKYNVFERNKK